MKEEEYMRVGTTLYKVVNQPCANGGYEKKRVVWNNSTLRQDYGKNYLATVPKYDGFCTVPHIFAWCPVSIYHVAGTTTPDPHKNSNIYIYNLFMPYPSVIKPPVI